MAFGVDGAYGSSIHHDDALPGGDTPECGSHSGLRWHCGQTHPGRHFEARDRLIAQGFEAVLPLGARQLPGGALRIEPLFGPYLIVRFDVAKPGWKRIPNTRGMRRLFGALQSRGASTFEVTDVACTRFLDDVKDKLESSVFVLGSCASSRSYWFSPSGEPALFRPTSVRNAVRAQDRFPISDYAIS